MRRRPRHHAADNTDRWVVSYADFVTLLFAFFTIMYALSNLDIGKVELFAGSVRSAFSKTRAEPKAQLIEGIIPLSPDVAGMEIEFQEALDPLKDKEGITLRRDPRGLIVSVGDALLFGSGDAGLKPQARPALDAIARVLQAHSNQITIEGHTDDVPISNEKFESNWELSTQRATNVLRYMTETFGLPPERFSASGYAEQRPIAPNITLDGRTQNRRVDIVVHADE